MGIVGTPHQVSYADDITAEDRGPIVHERASDVLTEYFAGFASRGDAVERTGPSLVAREAVVRPLQHRRRPGRVVLHRGNFEARMAIEDTGENHRGDRVHCRSEGEREI